MFETRMYEGVGQEPCIECQNPVGLTGNYLIYGFCTIFNDMAPSARPPLLLLDGHSSHYTPSVIRKAEEKVILFCLPPHSSHELSNWIKDHLAP